MGQIRVSTIVFGLLGLIGLAIAVDFGYGQLNYDARMASMTPLRVLLPQQQEAFRTTFTAGWSTSHHVALVSNRSARRAEKRLPK